MFRGACEQAAAAAGVDLVARQIELEGAQVLAGGRRHRVNIRSASIAKHAGDGGHGQSTDFSLE